MYVCIEVGWQYYLAYCISVVDCGVPLPVNRIILDSFNNTKFGALITFHCEQNDDSMTAVCGSDGEWIPSPTSLVCGEPGNTSSGTGIYS